MNLATIADGFGVMRNGRGTAAEGASRAGPPDYPKTDDPKQRLTRDELVGLVRDRYEYARNAKMPLLETWATCFAFLCGGRQQWQKWDPALRRLVSGPKQPDWRVMTVDNQMPSIIRGLVSRLTRATEQPKLSDVTDDPEEKEATENSERMLRHWWRENMDEAENEANRIRCLWGCAFLHDYWDPSSEAWVPQPTGKLVIDQETQEAAPGMKAVLAPVGDLCCEVLSPFDVFPDPATKFEYSAWVIVARRKPVLWIEDTFGVQVSSDEDREENILATLLPSEYGVSSTNVSASTSEPGGEPTGIGHATLLEYYEKPSKRYEHGRHLIVCNQELLFHADRLPLPHGKLPLEMIPFDPVPKRLWPKGIIEDLLDDQRELNRFWSNLAELFRLYRSPKRYSDKSWGVDEDDYTSAPDEVIEGNFRGANPAAYVERPPELPQWVAERDQQIWQHIQRKSGLNEVLQGQRPVGVTTATGLVTLQREAAQGLSDPSYVGMLGYKRFAGKINTSQTKLYREDRFALLLGKRRGERQSFLIEAGQVGIRPVSIDLTDGVQDTEELRQQQLQEFYPPQILATMPLEAQASLMEAAGLHWIAETLEKAAPAIQAQQQQAQAAQQQQMQGDQAAAEQQQQLQAQGQQQQQQAQAAAAQQQMTVQGAQAQQGMQVTAAQKAQELAAREAQHQQALRHQEEQHQAQLAQAAAMAKQAARVKPATRGKA